VSGFTREGRGGRERGLANQGIVRLTPFSNHQFDMKLDPDAFAQFSQWHSANVDSWPCTWYWIVLQRHEPVCRLGII